ncbi:M24 family metallopeptidase [Deinococcus radiodurans]|jgi:Xaa-Pro aminopeptidase|uniref:Proline dipeptidase n=1 Tax=Deinococcus radiodurans (strain ATCC 13939 / DSM 20539 / JCM 16871 / CCUG 27074 / LMG 4051 / NBRC 15346 / NCIMB 9279 / VKM B-1422 / R1) TaxID=243230 RepID=Q9RUY4_DEIRA|nr:Xaa-Pro peptidase family protein [Deinococcus radiodurans]5GIU_A Chain A, Proline dipeptidase [Deinococcus radiodurans R1 = ATCC 13939 = DSM 20539]AAF10817.1 proline dipeptidase [Deinococcus radiodurans R1 = ATCC 13939 = DSM 20539]ANC71591.1 aminopeptidase [Deinococcus radiodurans R1 = ATCC 13939 = DSM 20539]QEM70719.1 aminopeptidase P family protein [Deinococcus radiodurans]QIP32000.1 aminopeptidase P family protein [Deinococcus radiodurans]UDL00370.1 aminopeptidase P family protein [Dein
MSKMDQLRPVLGRAGVDALWVSAPANVRWLSGFTSAEDGKVLVSPDGATLYTDARYTVQAQEESSLPQYIARPPATYEHAADTVRGLRVGFEAESLTVAELEDLRQAWPNSTLVALRGTLGGLRAVKTPEEIGAIRAAQDLADRVYTEVRPMIRAGVRELDVAVEIETRLRRAGGESAFELIVASGPNGAKPHGHASKRVIEDGDLVTIDMGARLGGYNSDMTRTVAVGTPSAEMKRVYDAVLEAEEAAIAAIRPGVRAADLDKLARDLLTRHGLGEAFAHSLGHGVGLEVHEGPGLRGTSQDVLEAGMVITIEPGAYLPGVGGVRIEDLILVTEDGYEVLSHSAKESV